jgi:hypothetical protein
MADLNECVRRGAEMLDREYPDWAERVHLGSLDLWSEYDCVLGQLFPYQIERASHFIAGAVCLIGCDLSMAVDWLTDFGFDWEPSLDDYDDGYDTLTELWAAEVMKRRGVAVGA